MRVLVVGGGGREHALCWRLSTSQSVRKLFCCPGNPGTADCAENLPQGDIAEYCKQLSIDLVVVGPEAPLIAGLADCLRADGYAVYGPGAQAAAIEGSKAFSKELMASASIPTAEFQSFNDPAAASAFAKAMYDRDKNVVVKASGEALGKGAIVTSTADEALAAIDDIMVKKSLGAAGETVVVEERLEGEELSLFSLRSASRGFVAPAIRDYKPALDGGKGPNTGGMGARTVTGLFGHRELWQWGHTFCDHAAEALAARGIPYVGTLYAGLILTENGPFCLEYNCRFGDPETQALVRLDGGDWGELLLALATDSEVAAPQWPIDLHAAALTIASGGYPGAYEKGKPISGLEHATLVDEVIVFHAGTAMRDGRVATNGGRVLTVTATGSTLAQARERIYEAAGMIHFEGMQHRTDIAQ